MTTPNLAARFAAGVQVATPQFLHDLSAAVMVVATAHPDELGRHWASVSRELESLAFEKSSGVGK